jgi:hypothetical protein
MLQITHHAQARLQQRGIPAHALENLLEFGRYANNHRGATILFFDHKARNQLRRLIAGDDYKQIESYLDTYAILSGDGVVVTVGHRTKHIYRH